MQRERDTQSLRSSILPYYIGPQTCLLTNDVIILGAGLLSSIAELRHALSEDAKPKIKAFDPEVTAREECIITSFQNAYYYSESFEEAKDKMRFGSSSTTNSIVTITIL